MAGARRIEGSDMLHSSRVRAAQAAGLALALAACGGGGGGGGDGGAQLAGALSVLDPTLVVVEAEPNDTLAQAHQLGPLSAGAVLAVVGHTTTDPSDPLDGFALSAPERVQITLSLDFDPAGGNDFDVFVFDPVAMQFVEPFATASAPETGVFHAKGPFYLVVQAFSGEGAYTLRIRADVPADPIAEREPNDVHGEAQYLGEMVPGDGLVLAGTGDAVADAHDRLLVVCPEAVDLDLSLAFPGGADFDLVVSDATANLFNPSVIAQLATAANPEAGQVAIGPMTAVEIDIFAKSGAGAYTLALSAAAPDPSALARVPGRVASLEVEALRLARGGAQASFGRPLLPAPAGILVATPAREGTAQLSIARLGGAVLDRIPDGALRVGFELPPGLDELDLQRATLARLGALTGRPGIAGCELDVWRQACAQVPDDPFFNLQWHYGQIHLPAAWDISTGDGARIVAVIDTGETAHPDLVARQIAGYDFISDPANAGDGDGIDPDPTDVGDGNGVKPSSFHGTHVAGTIGADTDNGLGVAGVTWAGRVQHLRVLGKLGGSTFDVANAVRYAARLSNVSGTVPPERADVINLSLGGPGFSQTLEDAVDAARAAGVVLFAAAGNNNSTAPFYPAAYGSVISVSAVDLQGKKAPYSNTHATVALAAPGGDLGADLDGDGHPDGVLSTLYDDSSLPAQPVYGYYNGTSMASPHAAGVAALVLSVDSSLLPAQVQSILESTATDLGAPGKDPVYGHGLVNAYQAVLAASQGVPTTPVLGLSTQSLSFGASLVTLDVQVANLGGGLLSVGPIAVSTQSGGGWLAASAIPAPNPTTTDTLAVRVQVDRTALAEGAYAGEVQVQSNGGSAMVQVAMLVSSSAPVVNVDLYVLAVDSVTFETVAQDIVNPATGLGWKLGGLPAGTYFLFAGSDDDGDGFICGAGDVYCGAWPTLDDPKPIAVSEGESIAGLDFAVSGNFGASAAAGSARGWRLK
jgi:serine protease